MNKTTLKIVTTRKQYLKWSFRQFFKREKELRNGVIAIEKGRINLNKPTYIEANILDLIKVLMQDFHYIYADKAEKWLTDIDSLLYKIEAGNIYEDF